MVVGIQIDSIFDLVQVQQSTSPEAQAFKRIFSVRCGETKCIMGETLSQAYGLNQSGQQSVLSVTNRITNEQTWFNKIRSNKPQNFTQATKLGDPLEKGKRCDFCEWEQYTAQDSFGRIEYPDVVSASNLFKYCEPAHGVLLFKHHQPLDFNLNQLQQMLSAAQDWFQKSHEIHERAKYPFFLWNCLARAGASQFHGHAQIMLSQVPFPAQVTLDRAVKDYEKDTYRSYWSDLAEAHGELDLIIPNHNGTKRCLCFPYLCPTKDMEIFVLGDSLTDENFAKQVYLALRTLIDDLGVQTFNVGILNLTVGKQQQDRRPVLARIVSRGKLSSAASDFGGLEVFGGASIGHMDPFKLAHYLKAHEKQLLQ